MEEQLERFSLGKSMQPKGMLQKVGLIGCGSIGQEIALHVSQKGIDIVFIDLSEELVQASLKSMNDQLDELIDKWGMTGSEKKLVMQRITGSTKYEDLRHCDIIIETILSKKPGTSIEERMQVFERVEQVVSRDTVITSNTATLMISDLSAALQYPDRSLGMHFLSPVSRINIVEVVRHAATSDQAFEMVKKFCHMIGKKVVECSESPGNISTRMIVSMINEACNLLLEGVSTVTDIDEVMMEATGFEFGPFEMADKYGVDKIHKWMENLYREQGDLRFKPSPIIKRMVRAKMLGRHVGEGFYYWTDGVKKAKPGSIRTLGR
ncbi:MAG: 3-hydroxyacyl-CoA dehydrogenase family protein [Bacteroidales bacterium]|jgi:3-hydroxybutyryl-CoA dehydrogenase|nr:3-hydroxyacyl-CoA dehydrogenase family protein [Bacteroidales bacterium]NCU34937.1 3-hydroxyacyl-CoA dehydrogenase family protein [Candidatus Falkowbacteria bacterium]MDD2633487.1 3-hydroxyacyl-CoA dehydrogenase family protein [Bacteroidales bacterium]MDD3130369.1 3-hydroxyacyl-CoA dehydrogenase family protein [Bacteroidales bacterium]MDD4176075.1 3-hydroxyacyl-CoA dehydrogenase family protein [Bacteroidales bacterium]